MRLLLLVQLVTLSRVVAAGIFISIALVPSLTRIAIIAYIWALISDFADGCLARRFDCSTAGGKALDGFGDKYLTLASCFYAVILGVHPLLATLPSLRDLLVLSIRATHSKQSTVALPAKRWVGAITGFPVKALTLCHLVLAISRDQFVTLFWIPVVTSAASLGLSAWIFRHRILALFPSPQTTRT